MRCSKYRSLRPPRPITHILMTGGSTLAFFRSGIKLRQRLAPKGYQYRTTGGGPRALFYTRAAMGGITETRLGGMEKVT